MAPSGEALGGSGESLAAFGEALGRRWEPLGEASGGFGRLWASSGRFLGSSGEDFGGSWEALVFGEGFGEVLGNDDRERRSEVERERDNKSYIRQLFKFDANPR